LNHFLYGDKTDSLYQAKVFEENNPKERITYTGFIAQQVEKAAMEIGYDFSGVEKPANDHDHYRLSYSTFIVPLVKAVQEQQEMINALKEENRQLQQKQTELEARVAQMEESLKRSGVK
jgi:predicted RNase H-like nuclease (RuvC/YqgF family)